MTYNGWKNRATWNIALWINNDPDLYRKAVNYVKKCKKEGKSISWTGFSTGTSLKALKTPDGYAFVSQELCKTELTAMLKELLD